jgi:DNA-binding MarR family transcriptional regulator
MSQELRNELSGVDRLIHEPARMMIMTILNAVDEADFLYLLTETGLTRGNLSTHLSKLEEAGYIKIEKTFRGKIPRTVCTLSEAGRAAFEKYRKQLRQIAGRI